MKKILSFLLLMLIFHGWVKTEAVMAQGTAPALSINLVLNKARYVFFNPPNPNSPDDLIEAELTIKNTGGTPIITTAGFADGPFHLFLNFVDPNGKGILATQVKSGDVEPAAPNVVVINGALVQVEKVEVLPVGFVKTVNIPDVRKFYSLITPGQYSVKVIRPLRTYATFFSVSGVNYASLDSANFAGALVSNVVRFLLVTDADRDGFYSDLDCDDNDPTVNPGMKEIRENGKDDDCNPATLDTVAPPQLGDVNGDGKIDCVDLALVKYAFGKRRGEVGFDSRADVNGDGIVNVKDLALVSQKVPPGTQCK
jgi:hypothetical protein